MKLDTETLEAISRAETSGNRLVLVGQLEPKAYKKVAAALIAAGGKWSRKEQATIFDGDAAEAIEPLLLTGEVHRVKQDFGQFDIAPLFWAFAAAHKDAAAVMPIALDFFTLKLDTSSTLSIHFEEPGAGILIKSSSWGFQNVAAYLADAMQRMNGREVTVSVSADAFSIEADPDEDVANVLYFGSGNDARVPEGRERDLCKVGQGKNCCIFFGVGGNGFTCMKFGSGGRYMLERLEQGRTNAGRIGDCRLAGREKDHG